MDRLAIKALADGWTKRAALRHAPPGLFDPGGVQGEESLRDASRGLGRRIRLSEGEPGGDGHRHGDETRDDAPRAGTQLGIHEVPPSTEAPRMALLR